MGVDVRIFAKVAKKKFIGDRDHVLRCWYDTEDKFDDLVYRFYNPAIGLNMYETLILLAKIRCWKETHKEDYDDDKDRLDYAIYWLNQFESFVKKHPEDTFFAMNDHNYVYGDICDDYESVF